MPLYLDQAVGQPRARIRVFDSAFYCRVASPVPCVSSSLLDLSRIRGNLRHLIISVAKCSGCSSGIPPWKALSLALFFPAFSECLEVRQHCGITRSRRRIIVFVKEKERTTKEKQQEVSNSKVSRQTSDHDEGAGGEKKGANSSSSNGRNPTSTKEDSKDVTFIVLQKNTRSMNSSVRIDEMFSGLQGCRWDAILVSETWRPEEEEIWESKQGHVIKCAGKFENKHGVAIVVNKKWKHKMNRTNYMSERAIAPSITVNTQRVTLMSVYMPHSGYADYHVEKTYNTIEKSHQAHEEHAYHRRRLQR